MRCVLYLLLVMVVSAEPELSIVDMMPAIAQLKSVVQWIAGEKDAAAQTQQNYLNNGWGPSQLRSAYFLVTGESKKALEIQLTFLNNLEVVVDGMPVVGHAKGVYHLVTNDTKHGWQALKSSTSSVGVVLGAVAGGPIGAVGGHVLTDMLITGVDALVSGNESQPHGIVEYVVNLDKVDAGGHFDTVTGLITDAVGAKIGTRKSGKANNGVSMPEPKSEVAGLDTEPLLISFNRLPVTKENKGVRTAPNDVLLKAVGSSPEANLQALRSEGSSNTFQYMGNAWTDRVKQLQFKRFVQIDKAYKHLNLEDQNPDVFWTRFSLGDLKPYSLEYVIQNLNIKALTSKFRYLSGEHISLIEKNDFRLINTNPYELKNCLACSIGGILKKDVRTMLDILPDSLPDAYSCTDGSYNIRYLDACKSAKLIDFKLSDIFTNIRDFDIMLQQQYSVLKDKHLILARGSSTKKVPGHAVVLKYKLASPNRLYPVKLLIDFQKQPMVSRDLPNPYRFQHFLNDQKYNIFQLIIVTVIN